jgi:hypothetical protein
MIRTIYKLIGILKEHVNQNNQEIQFNQEEIDRILSGISVNTTRKELDSKYKLNKQLLDENSDFVKLQIELTEFIDKYKQILPDKDSDDEPLKSFNDLSDVFNQTISGILNFDPDHPQFNDKVFARQLFDYYKSQENYEMCEKLLKFHKF